VKAIRGAQKKVGEGGGNGIEPSALGMLGQGECLHGDLERKGRKLTTCRGDIRKGGMGKASQNLKEQKGIMK